MSNTSLIATQPDINATVTASAGSGKTWLLITRIIRLLLSGAEPGSILALTFTRKAAGEMQMRLHERLYEMSTADDEKLTEILKIIGAKATADSKQRAKNLYEELLHHLYPVRLKTFHSFCQDILAKFPLEADVPPGFELLEDTSLLEQQAWEGLFKEATDDPDGLLATDLDYLMQHGNGPSNTRKALTSMLMHRSDWWAYTENQASPAEYATEQLKQQLNLAEQQNPVDNFFKQATLTQLNEFTSLLRKHNTATNEKHANLMEALVSQQTFDTEALKRLRTAFLTAKGQPLARKASKAQEKNMSAQGQQRFLELHVVICEQIVQALDALLRIQTFDINQAWYRTGHRFIEIFQRLKRELRMLDFTDLEWNCYQLLNTSDNALWVQYKIDQRIDHFLIDEFQDTNPTQWQLLSPLLEEMAASPDERHRSVFLVGDEKQSIYGFRRANPALQSQASDWLHKHLSAQATPLDFSWRSSPAIIDFVNRVFQHETVQQYMPGFKQHGTHKQNLPGKVELSPLFEEPEQTLEEKTESTGLRNPLLQPRLEIPAIARTNEAENIAFQIENLISAGTAIADGDDTRAATYSDIIILIRNRTHIDAYEKALREKNIPFVGSQRGTLLDSLEIQDLEKLLDTLVTPYDNLALAQVLKSPIFDASDEDLMLLALIKEKSHWYERLHLLPENLEQHHPLKRAASLLPRWRSLVDTVPVHDLLDRIFAEANLQQRYVSAVSESYRQRVQANLHRFLELSLELDSGRYPSLSHFLHYLRSLRKPEASSPDEPVISAGDSRVRLMTIHASKGLEAPIVFLADCDSGGSGNDAFTALVNWPANTKKPEGMQLVLSKDKTDSVTENVQQTKAAAQTREQLNLLYVALTRAKQYLVISGVAAKRSSSGWYQLIHQAMSALGEEERDNSLKYVHGKLAQHVDDNKAISKTTSPVNFIAGLDKAFDHLPATEHMIAPSRTTQHSDVASTPEQELDSEHGQLRGIIIHRALDLLSREQASEYNDVHQQLASEFGISISDADLKTWLQEAVNTTRNPEFSNIFFPQQDVRYHNELPILYETENGAVYGLIDRLIIRDNDILLIDYKTHINVTKDNAKTSAETFSEQMRLYSEGVKRIWPGCKIQPGLLFTRCEALVWLT